jgi:hypothetical protein
LGLPAYQLPVSTSYFDAGRIKGNAVKFALLTTTHILTQRTRKNDKGRYKSKQLFKWNKQRVIDLFRVIDWMMRLPGELEYQLWKYSRPGFVTLPKCLNDVTLWKTTRSQAEAWERVNTRRVERAVRASLV